MVGDSDRNFVQVHSPQRIVALTLVILDLVLCSSASKVKLIYHTVGTWSMVAKH